MQPDSHKLDYHSVRPGERVRARRWLSHMRTAAVLCVAAVCVDRALRYDAGEAARVAQIEVALAAYGATCAAVSLARGALTATDKLMVGLCVLLFALTGYVGTLMPRVIHN